MRQLHGKESSRVGNTLHVYVKEEEWEMVHRVVHNGKESEHRMRFYLARTILGALRCAKGTCDAVSDCTRIAEIRLSSRSIPPGTGV